MTVKELVSYIGRNDLTIPAKYADRSIEDFVSIWEDLNEERKKEYEAIARLCSSALLLIKGAPKIPSVKRGSIANVRPNVIVGTVKPKKEYPSELSYVLDMTIDEAIKLDFPLERNVKLERHFRNETDNTLRAVLDTDLQEFASLPRMGKDTKLVLSDWQEVIEARLKLLENNEISIDPAAFLDGHSCKELEIVAIIKSNPQFQGNKDVRLMNALDKINCKLVVDLFRVSDSAFGDIFNSRSKTYNLFVDLKQYIRGHLKECDELADKLKEDEIITELPVLGDNQQNVPFIQKIVIAIQQLCDVIQKKSTKHADLQKIQAMRTIVLENRSCEDLVNVLNQQGEDVKSKTRYEQYIEDFINQMLSGAKDPILKNYYLSSDIVERIHQVSEDVKYKSIDYLCQQIEISRDDVIRYTGVLRSIFDIVIAQPSQNNKASHVYKEMAFVVPKREKNDFLNGTIKNLFKYLQKQIVPLSAEQISGELCSLYPEELIYQDTDALNHILENYKFVDAYSTYPITYRLSISKMTDLYQAATIIFDHRGEQNLTDEQVLHLLYELTGEDVKGLKTRLDNSHMKDVSCGIFKSDAGVWNYDPQQQKQFLPSLRTFIHDYAVQHGIFHISKLKEELEEQYQKTYKDATLMVYVYNNCVQALGENGKGWFCYEKVTNTYPQYTWRQRKDGDAVNYSLNVLRSILQSSISSTGSGKKVSWLRQQLISAQEQDGYNKYRIENIIQSYATRSEDDIYKPFIIYTKGDILYLDINRRAAENIDWEKIGLNATAPFRELIIARVIEALRAADNQTCERGELFRVCKPLLEENETNYASIIHEVLYHQLPAEKIEWHTEGKQAYFHLIATEEETHEAPVELIPSTKESTTETKQALPVNTPRPEPNREIFVTELTRVMQSYRAEWPWNMEKSINKFVDFLWDVPAKRLGDRLKQLWYEYLAFKVDKYSVYSAYSESLIDYEKFIRILYEEFTGEMIRGTFGLGGTMSAIPCMDDFNRSKGSHMRDDIYESVYRNRNTISHGEDLPKELNLYTATRDVLALYVYTYALMDSRC